MEKFLRNNPDLVFWLISITLAFLLLIATLYSLNFILKKSGMAFGNDLIQSEEIAKFKLNEIKQLKER